MATKQETIPAYLRKKFFAVMNAHGFDEARRRELIWGWTGRATDSYTGMTPAQVSGLIDYVERTYTRPLTDEEAKAAQSIKTMRSKAMKIATQLGLLPVKAMGEKLSYKEWLPFNGWIAKHLHKPTLNALDAHELAKAIDMLDAWSLRVQRANGTAKTDEA